MRANQFLAWIDSGDYQKVLNGRHDVLPSPAAGAKSFCVQCGQPLRGEEAFCPGCGFRLPEPLAVPTSPMP
jgi:predicted amidophosphoribosyltransferase